MPVVNCSVVADRMATVLSEADAIFQRVLERRRTQFSDEGGYALDDVEADRTALLVRLASLESDLRRNELDAFTLDSLAMAPRQSIEALRDAAGKANTAQHLFTTNARVAATTFSDLVASQPPPMHSSSTSAPPALR